MKKDRKIIFVLCVCLLAARPGLSLRPASLSERISGQDPARATERHPEYSYPYEIPKKVSIVFAVVEAPDVVKDFVRKKIAQARNYFSSHPELEWEMIIVDDKSGRSGEAIEKVLNTEYPELVVSKKIKVRYLKNVLAEEGLGNTAESKKGGSVVYGMKEALRGGADYVVFTDADTSMDLAQLDKVLPPVIYGRYLCCIGSKGLPESGLEGWSLKRRVQSRLYNRAARILLPWLGPIQDTQCGFKAFRRELLEEILPKIKDKGFSFDTEILTLLRIFCYDHNIFQSTAVKEIPIRVIDAGVSTVRFRTSFEMAKGLFEQRKRYAPLVSAAKVRSGAVIQKPVINETVPVFEIETGVAQAVHPRQLEFKASAAMASI